MNNRLAIFGALALLVGCPAAKKPEPPPTAPRITSFTIDRTQVLPGQEVKLAFTATNATKAALVDQTGSSITLTGDAAAGGAAVKPTVSSIYVLRVEGAGGRDAQFVQVSVGETLKEVFLVAVPPEVQAGDEVQLIYSAFRATGLTLAGSDGTMVPVTGQSGVAHVTPTKTTRYTLTAANGDAGVITSQVEVKVRPVLISFELTPAAAKSGEKLTLAWKTAGADELTITEANFGELLRTSDPLKVPMGQLEWIVPGALSADGGTVADAGIGDGGSTDGGSGLQLPEGFPLKFTLTVKSTDPAMTLTRLVEGFVGAGARIDSFNAPVAATIGSPITLTWATTNAVGLQVFVNGLLVYEPLPSNTTAISAGSFRLTAPAQDTTFELVATSFRGLTARATRQVLAVKPPKLTSVTLPAAIGMAGSSATAAWTTLDASEVQIQLKNGPTAFITTSPVRVAAGMTPLFPGRTSTFVFTARNQAGDSAVVEKTITVNSPANVAVTPSPTTPGTPITFTWDLSGTSGFTNLYGVPTPAPTPINASTKFVDLTTSMGTKPLTFAEPNDAVAVIPATEGFRFPFLGRMIDSFTVSTNGFVALGGAAALPLNADLSMDNSVPPLLAPYWDDLTLGAGGAISYLIAGTAYPRVLIVQWTGVELPGDATSRLTFQVQLSETGGVSFVYKTLFDANGLSSGMSATIGVQQSKDAFFGQHGFNTAGTVSAGLELEWFTSSQLTGTAPYVARGTAFHSLVWTKGSDYVQALVPLYVFGAEAIGISEAMPLPDPQFSAGQWIELHNRQSIEVELGGLTLRSMGSTTGFVIPPGTTVPPNSFLVVGDSIDPALNGDAGVTLVGSDIALAPVDTLRLSLGISDISVLGWTESIAGTSTQRPEGAIDNNSAEISCTRVKTFNASGNVGTPGRVNETCFDYTVTAIAGGFENLDNEGTPLLPLPVSDDTGYGVASLPAPFTYFGTTFNEINVSMDGVASFGPPLTASLTTNAVKPLIAAPNGLIAPFWDDLVRLPTVGKIVIVRRSNYTIVGWQHFRIYSPSGGDLSFQIKLYDDRSIEFHYGTMTPTPTALTRSTGLSATTWIEKLNGEAALPININTADKIFPNTAYRFIPQ